MCSAAGWRRHRLSFNAAKAYAERTPKGWCLIGWVVRDSGRESWNAYYNVFTKEGRLRKQTDER